MTTRTTRAAIFTSALCAGAALTLALAGCNVFGPAYYFIVGPPKAAARFELDPSRPTIVFVDDADSRLPLTELRATIAESATANILSESLVKDMIDGRAAIQVALKDRYSNPMTVAEIGRAAQAEVVIYVSVETFSLSPDGQIFAPVAKGRVTVIDAKTDARIWPPERAGEPFEVNSRTRQGTAPNTPAEVENAERQLAITIGKAVAQKFFEHYPSDAAGMEK